MPAWDDDLTQDQAFHLIRETESARQILGFGLEWLETATLIEGSRDSIMTLLSIGAEKLSKMALGLANVRDHRVWLPRTTFQSRYGHDLVRLTSDLAADLRGHLDLATHSPYIGTVLSAVERDPVWPAVVATLNRFGREGRFFELDGLAESPQRQPPPRQFRDEAERIALDSEALLGEQFARASISIEGRERFNRALNRRLAESVRNWWESIFRSGMHGMLSDRGTAWAADLGGPPQTA